MAGDRTWYLDTSVALRVMLGHDAGATAWYASTEPGTVVSSRLLHLECVRALRRDGLATRVADEFAAELVLLGVDSALVAEAASIRPHVTTLDALHLASAMRLGAAATTIVSHDRTMLTVGEALGFATHDPVRG
ncbi:PIN domain-containing protein [Demequina soli]|uniref:PIN domain-containing protein n=1 Tax=Demequina soli TaxID=1638987 RepID=UPI0007849F2B|nr:PIN domain-containing protein [Demequina soli]